MAVVAIRSLWGFGFLGLLVVLPVVSLISVFLSGAPEDDRWLSRLALVVLMMMIAWRRWFGVLAWPIFFVLFWLLNVGVTGGL